MSGLPALAPSDLLHGLALRPPVVAWDGVRYQGSLLSTLRLDEVRSQAGVVAVVRHANFAGVVAVTPLYARQAAGDLAAVWQAPRDGGAQADVQADAAAYHLRLPLTQTGARVIVWSLNGHTSVWLPACAPDVQAAVRCELAVLLQQADTAIGVALINDGAPAKGQLLDLMDAAAEAALLSQSTGRPVCVPCQAQAAAELVLRPAQAGAAEVLPGKVMPAAPAASVLHAQGPWAMRPSLARLLSQPAQACASAQATVCGDIPLVARKQTVIAPRAYACLVAIMAMGRGYHRKSQERLTQRTAENGATAPVITSAGALVDALHIMGAKKIALVAPYMIPLTELVMDYISAEGFEIVDWRALQIPDNLEVGRHDPAKLPGIVAGMNVADADVIVLSACVQMPSLAAVAQVEAETGKPVLTASIATTYAILKSLGLDPVVPGAGALLSGAYPYSRSA